MYELTQLFWYRPLFMTELLVAESLFVMSLNRRRFFLLRALAAILACYGLSFAFPIAFSNAVWFSFMFLSFFAFTVVALKFIFNESLINIFYCAIAGYTTQHIAYEIYDLIVVAANINASGTVNRNSVLYSVTDVRVSQSGITRASGFKVDGSIVSEYLESSGITFTDTVTAV